MEPMTAYLAITAGATLANAAVGWWTNEKKMKEMRRYLNAMDRIQKKIENEWATLKDPKIPVYNMSPLTAEEYSLVAKYSPEIAQQVIEKKPQLLSEEASSFAKSTQFQALQQYREKARGGETAQARASRARGLYEADAASRQALERILSQTGADAGTKAVLAAQMGQAADQNRYLTALNAAAMDEQAQMQALQNMAGLAGEIRNQNYRTEAANADIINAFNQRAAQNQWIYNQEKARTLNQAKLLNLQNQQNIANANVDLRNRMAMYNRAREDDILRSNAALENEWNWRDTVNKNDKLRALNQVAGSSAAAAYSGYGDYYTNMGQGISNLISGAQSIYPQYMMLQSQLDNDAAKRDLYKAQTDFYTRNQKV